MVLIAVSIKWAMYTIIVDQIVGGADVPHSKNQDTVLPLTQCLYKTRPTPLVIINNSCVQDYLFDMSYQIYRFVLEFIYLFY